MYISAKMKGNFINSKQTLTLFPCLPAGRQTFGTLGFWILILFRISDLGFRILSVLCALLLPPKNPMITR